MTTAFEQDFAAFRANGGSGGPAWLPALRQRAMARFTELGFPTARNEDWKFTSVAPIARAQFRRGLPGDAATVRVRLAEYGFAEPGWSELVFLNGRYLPEASRSPGLPGGVRVTTLAEALAADGSGLRDALGRTASFDQSPFTALNTAFLQDGAFIEVPPGVAVPAPIHLVWLTDGRDGPVTHPRTLVRAGEGAEVTVLETYGPLHEGAAFTNAVTEVEVGADARVEHIKIQREGTEAFHVGTVEAQERRNSRFRSFSFAIGAALSRTNIYAVMSEPGADCTMNGLYLVAGTQHVDHQTRIEHAAPACTSREIYKGVLDGRSHAVFNGKVFVRPEAQQTDGKQTNKNLLLSEGARVDTKPQLEIFADDVKCTHGATVGRLDDLATFYLRSRGISPSLARQILTYGFAEDVLVEVRLAPVRERLERLIIERLTA